MSFDTLPNGGYKCMVKKQRHKASITKLIMNTYLYLSLVFAIQICKHFCKVPKINGKIDTADLFFVFLQHIPKACSNIDL